MTLREVKTLGCGDEVYWNDPDAGSCNKMITIGQVWVIGEVVCIHGKDGSYLECFAHELS
jgi:hypothetical protein